ncbi:protein phosphatase CheZ [Amorphus sp. MBR-141]
MSAGLRPYRIERAGRDQKEANVEAPTALLTHFDRIHNELADLKDLIARLEERAQDGSAPKGGVTLLAGVETIQDAIKRTRGELGALNAKGNKKAQFHRATDELDAVVSDTEGATDAILATAETIEALASRLSKSASLENAERELVEQIHENTVRIFEACNFQDITGQRISKVVGLMHFIETRLATMADIWKSFGSLNEEYDAEAQESHSFSRTASGVEMHGPVLNGDADVVSQDDIDSLFP